MITPEQVRAARALLDWSTTELARRTGLTVNGLNKIERAHVTAQRETMEKIKQAFEEAGLEFLPGEGLRRRDNKVQVYEGKEARRKQIMDVYETLKETGGLMTVAHQSESSALDEAGFDFVISMAKKRREAKIYHRLLVLEDDNGMTPPYDTYHIMPQKYFAPHQVYVYGSKVALSTRKYASKVVIINDERIARCVGKMVDFVWDHTKQPTAQMIKRVEAAWAKKKEQKE